MAKGGRRGFTKFFNVEVTDAIKRDLEAGMGIAAEAVADRASILAPKGKTSNLKRDLTYVVETVGNDVHGWVGIKKGSPAAAYALRRMETGFYGRDSLGRFVKNDPRPGLLTEAAGQVQVKIMRSLKLGKGFVWSKRSRARNIK